MSGSRKTSTRSPEKIGGEIKTENLHLHPGKPPSHKRKDGTDYVEDLMSAMKRSLRASAAAALEAGVAPERLIVDPGIGFGKTPEHNLVVLRRLGELRELGYPILVGPSRKSFLGRLFGQEMPIRPWGTAAAVTAAVLRGADIVRVHDLPEMLAVVQVAEALRNP